MAALTVALMVDLMAVLMVDLMVVLTVDELAVVTDVVRVVPMVLWSVVKMAEQLVGMMDSDLVDLSV